MYIYIIIMCHMSPVTCHLSPITCHLIFVTCHLSPTATATDPHPDNSPTMHSRLVQQNRTKKPKIIQNPKKGQNLSIKKWVHILAILAIPSSTRSHQPSWFWSFHWLSLFTEGGKFATNIELEKICEAYFFQST